MIEKLIVADTLPEAYHKALLELENYGEVTNCDDWNTTQKELSMTFQVLHPLQEPRISKCFIGGPKELEQYRQEMLYGILDFEVQRGKWAYTYHERMVKYPIYYSIAPHDIGCIDQIQFVIKELKRNPSSRRAVIVVRHVLNDAKSEEPACMQLIQYFVRNNKLDCDVLFRSNDACKATFMNAFALICLQEMIAKELGLEVGTYTHRANSFHCYEKDFDLLKGYCSRIKNDVIENITYNYLGEWDELMESYQPEIEKQVEKLKNNM